MSGRAKGALVHEGGAKPDNGRQVVPRPFTTAKLVYSQRVTDEFMMWDRERQGEFVAELVDNLITKSIPRDIDTVVLHGYDPFTNTLDTQLSDYIAKPGSSILVPSTGDTAAAIDTDYQTAVADLEGQDINGIAISGKAAQLLSTITEGNEKKYPGTSVMGLVGDTLAGVPAASTPEVGAINNTKLVMGDWSQLLLGFAGNADWKVIEYGNPDGGEYDLQQANQVCIRLELKFGFRVLDPSAFAVVSNLAPESE